MTERPNIVLVTSDQQRADFTAGAGFGLDTMPFLDELAGGGTRYHRAYTTAPACVPARTSLLTGRFPSATRVRQNSNVEHALRGEDLLDVLGRAGYTLHFAGKPHMYRDQASWDTWEGPYGHDHGPRPHPSAADEAFERWLVDLDHGVSQVPTPFGLEQQYAHRATSGAIAATTASARPFFCWLSFPEPHNPYQAPEPYYSMFDPEQVPDRLTGPESAEVKGGAYRWLRELVEEKRPGYDRDWRRYRAVYCGMLRMLDDQLRRLVEHLEATGAWANTLFVFTADHGDYVGEYGLQRKGAGMPECLMRVPLVVTGPGVVRRDDTDNLVSLADVFPTLCEAADAGIPAGVQGRSLWPLLTGAVDTHEEFASVYAERGYGGLAYTPDERPELHYPYEGPTFDELNTVTQSGSTRMLRRGDHKLLYDEAGRGELYDLRADPAELTNRFDDPASAGVRAELLAELLRWCIRAGDDLLPLGRYTPKRAPHNWAAGEARS